MAKKKDDGHDETEQVLADLEKRINKEYAQAEQEIQEKLDDYLRRFKVKDEIKRQAWQDGKITKQEYEQWRYGQICVGERWQEMKDTLAEDYTNAAEIAKSITDGYMPEVYAINHNYGTYQVEQGAMVDTSYTLYDRHSVQRLFDDDNKLYHDYGIKVGQQINAGKQMAWDKKQIQSVMTQALLQGESIGNIATRLSKTVGDSDRKACIRNARTMTTGVQNAGRVDSYKRAQDMGIDLMQEWLATLDSRTRHEHRQLDGQRVKVGEPFKIDGYELDFPADPKGAAHLVYNCRCTLVPVIKGFEIDASDLSERNTNKMQEQTYEEWKNSHEITSDAITKQDDIADTMRRSYNRDYRELMGQPNRGIMGQRGMSNGQRKSPWYKLNDEDIKTVKSIASDINIPLDVLRFNTGYQTGFSDFDEIINIKGDVFPDLNSTNLRDRLSIKCVLAHEYYGHYKNHPSNFKVGDWRDEFKASYRAAIDTPNLTDDERRMLMLDAYDRAKEAGVTVTYNKTARRLIYGYDEE